MPVTATNKIHRVALRREGFRCPDPVWWGRGGDGTYAPLDAVELAALLTRYAERGTALWATPRKSEVAASVKETATACRAPSGTRTPDPLIKSQLL